MAPSLNTFLYADLCGFTQYTLDHGDERAAQLAVGFQQLVRELAYYESCEVVRTVGDAVLVRARGVTHAYRLAEQIQQAAAQRGYPSIRMGMDTGPAVPAAGDWYGNTVNMAVRVAEAAEPDELLMTERTRAALGRVSDSGIVERGVHALKGLPDSLLHGTSAMALQAA